MLTNRVAVAALAVFLVVVGGGFALTRLAGVGDGGPSPSPISSPIPSQAQLSLAPSLTIRPSDVGRALPAGSYRVDEFTAPFSVTLPAGWTVREFTPNNLVIESGTGDNSNVTMIVLDKVYADPCHTADGPSVIGAGVADLVTAFSSMPDFTVANVRDAIVGGARGKVFEFGNSIDLATAGCSGQTLLLGTYRMDGEDTDVSMFGGERDSFWVLDANGTRVLIAITGTTEIVENTQAVLNTISFGAASSD